MACKGICDRYKASKPQKGSRYAQGQKRCQTCSIYVTWEGIWCPCCTYRLRSKPRSKVYKEKLRIQELHI